MVLQNVACAHAPSDRTLNGSESEDVRASPWGSFLMSQVDNCHFPAVWTPQAAVRDHRWLCQPSTLETNNGHLCMFYMILTSCHAWIKWHKFELRFLFRQPPERSSSIKAVEQPGIHFNQVLRRTATFGHWPFSSLDAAPRILGM